MDVPVIMQLKFQQFWPIANVKVPQIQFIYRLRTFSCDPEMRTHSAKLCRKPEIPQVQGVAVDVPVNGSDKLLQFTRRLVCKLCRKPSATCGKFSVGSWTSSGRCEEGFFRRFLRHFRTPPHGVESLSSGEFFGSLDGQQLFVVKGSRCTISDDLWTNTSRLRARVQNNNNDTIWRGSVLTGEEPPPHSGALNHALSHVGGPTQSQLSRPMSSGHNISMEHRARRKHLLLNSNFNAGSGIYISGKRNKKKKRLKKEKQQYMKKIGENAKKRKKEKRASKRYGKSRSN